MHATHLCQCAMHPDCTGMPHCGLALAVAGGCCWVWPNAPPQAGPAGALRHSTGPSLAMQQPCSDAFSLFWLLILGQLWFAVFCMVCTAVCSNAHAPAMHTRFFFFQWQHVGNLCPKKKSKPASWLAFWGPFVLSGQLRGCLTGTSTKTQRIGQVEQAYLNRMNCIDVSNYGEV